MSRDYYAKHKEDPQFRQKEKARSAVTAAIASGKLTRGPCSNCDRRPAIVDGRQVVQAHHPRGYGDEHLLDIEWLCSRCHGLIHRGDPRAAYPVVVKTKKPAKTRLEIRPPILRGIQRLAGAAGTNPTVYVNDVLAALIKEDDARIRAADAHRAIVEAIERDLETAREEDDLLEPEEARRILSTEGS